MEIEYPDGKIDKEHYKLFLCHYDGEFNIQKEELSHIQFFSVEEINRMIKEDKDQFTPGFREEFHHYLDFISRRN